MFGISQADDLLESLGADARPRRVQDEEVKARERFLLENIFHPPFEEAAVADVVEGGVFLGGGDVRGSPSRSPRPSSVSPETESSIEPEPQ